MTISQGGTRKISPASARAAITRSSAEKTAPVKTGFQRAASSNPTTGCVGHIEAGAEARDGLDPVPVGQGPEHQQERGQVDSGEGKQTAGDAVGRELEQCACIEGEREQRTGHGLRRTIPGKEQVAIDETWCHQFVLKQGQHDVAAAEDESAGAIEAINDFQP